MIATDPASPAVLPLRRRMRVLLVQAATSVWRHCRDCRRSGRALEEPRTDVGGRPSPVLSRRMAAMRLLFVCMGNICRSPTAEAVMRGVLRREGLEDTVEVDSAGLGAWHLGEPPDRRSTAAARTRGIVMEGAARQVTAADFDHHDLLLA